MMRTRAARLLRPAGARTPAAAVALGAAIVLAGCGQSATSATDDSVAVTTAASSAGELFPDVVDASATLDADGSWRFSVTLSSPYDSPERYADAWRVVGTDGTVYGVRELTHDHADEQPFTRSQSGIDIPGDVEQVVIEGRDQLSGWGGGTLTLELER
jgi:hypothetical protein